MNKNKKPSPSLTGSQIIFVGDSPMMASGNSGTRKKLAISSEQDESIKETAAIMADPDLMRAIKISEQQIADGKTVSWESVKAELGL